MDGKRALALVQTAHPLSAAADDETSLHSIDEPLLSRAQRGDSAAFRAEFDKFAAIHGATFRGGYPAWTAVGTTALLADGAPVELRALAIVGAGKRVTVQRSAPAP